MLYDFESEVWRHDGAGGWHFATLPAAFAEGVKALRGPPKAWGSVRVRVTIGRTSWRTSLFPDARSGSFLLPVKAEVRRREQIAAGETRRFVVELEQ